MPNTFTDFLLTVMYETIAAAIRAETPPQSPATAVGLERATLYFAYKIGEPAATHFSHRWTLGGQAFALSSTLFPNSPTGDDSDTFYAGEVRIPSCPNPDLPAGQVQIYRCIITIHQV